MKMFGIGATGQVGSAVARRMVAAGHEVTGFARDANGAAKLEAWGIRPFVGNLGDGIDAVIAEARAADATIFSPQLLMDEEYATVSTLLDGLAGSGKAFLFTSGTGVIGKRTAGAWDENSWSDYDDEPVYSKTLAKRVATETLVRAAADRGIRAIVMRPPVIWGYGLHSITSRMLASYEKTGKVCYIGEGLNCYTTVHVDDLADLYLAAAERGTAGALYHAASGEVPNRAIAELLAKRFGCETRSVTMDEAMEIWDKFAVLIVLAASSRSRSPRAREELGWVPTRTDIISEFLTGDLVVGRNAPGVSNSR